MDNRDNQNLGFIFDSTLPLTLYSLFINTSCQLYLRNISRLALGHLQCSSQQSPRLPQCGWAQLPPTWCPCLHPCHHSRLWFVLHNSSHSSSNRKADQATPLVHTLHWLPISFRMKLKSIRGSTGHCKTWGLSASLTSSATALPTPASPGLPAVLHPLSPQVLPQDMCT